MAFCIVTLLFGFVCGCRAFVIGLSQISSFSTFPVSDFQFVIGGAVGLVMTRYDVKFEELPPVGFKSAVGMTCTCRFMVACTYGFKCLHFLLCNF